MSPESLTYLAKQDKSKKPEKSQEELRSTLENHLLSLKPTIDEEIKIYQQALEDDTFLDKEGEPEGSGEKRKEEMQNKINSIVERAEKLKAKLDSKEPLPQTTPELSATYTHPDKKKETLVFNIEQKLQDFTKFYKKTNLDLPQDFEETIAEIWERNKTEIEQAIEQNGFDDLLIIPGNIPLTELKDKMSMEKGYYTGSNFDEGGGFAGAVSKNVDKPRIILYHHKESLPEISKETGLDIHLNIKGEDALKLYNANPNNYLSTLEDAIILERKYFEDTNKHLSSYTTNSAQWLPGTGSGARLVYSYWRPDDRRLNVSAIDLESQRDNLGVRPSRSFF